MPANVIHVSTGLVLHDIEKVGMNLTVQNLLNFMEQIIFLLVNIRFGYFRFCGIDTNMD